ncbi:hypothetical protein IMZ48_14225 [Candidatus Bathyarchaeota archaeon]|nr:hypothetical protein [Candidatus Bathyarchaeota archaeon]
MGQNPSQSELRNTRQVYRPVRNPSSTYFPMRAQDTINEIDNNETVDLPRMNITGPLTTRELGYFPSSQAATISRRNAL